MHIILTAVDEPLADARQRYCGSLACVSVHHGSILDLEVDAVVSPANSFGFMDGGIDLLYSEHFGWHVQDRLQTLIRSLHHGELVVGQAEIVLTGDDHIPYLIAAPTMRVPMILRDSVNPYLAARAVFLLVKHGVFRTDVLNGRAIAKTVQTIAVPGLGTGIGQVSPKTCARQVRAAIHDIVLGKNKFEATPHPRCVVSTRGESVFLERRERSHLKKG